MVRSPPPVIENVSDQKSRLFFLPFVRCLKDNLQRRIGSCAEESRLRFYSYQTRKTCTDKTDERERELTKRLKRNKKKKDKISSNKMVRGFAVRNQRLPEIKPCGAPNDEFEQRQDPGYG